VNRAVITLSGFVALSFLGACATVGDFEILENRVAQLEMERKRLKAEMAEDVNRLENLHSQLTKAEETLRRSGANLGIRMETLESDLPHVRGLIEATSFQLNASKEMLEKIRREMFDRVGATGLYLPSELPADADGLWSLCQAKLKSGETREARAALDHFEASYPKDDRADDALMLLAKHAELEGDISRAVEVYQQVHDRYPEGDQVIRALWRIGELLEKRGNCNRAVGIYEYLSRKFKDSELGEKGKAKAEELSKSCQP
jgi:TolA-binding protein